MMNSLSRSVTADSRSKNDYILVDEGSTLQLAHPWVACIRESILYYGSQKKGWSVLSDVNQGSTTHTLNALKCWKHTVQNKVSQNPVLSPGAG